MTVTQIEVVQKVLYLFQLSQQGSLEESNKEAGNIECNCRTVPRGTIVVGFIFSKSYSLANEWSRGPISTALKRHAQRIGSTYPDYSGVTKYYKKQNDQYEGGQCHGDNSNGTSETFYIGVFSVNKRNAGLRVEAVEMSKAG